VNVTRQIGGNINSVSQQVKEIAFLAQSYLTRCALQRSGLGEREFVRESMASVRDAIVIGSCSR
jgi:hypothetical protein